MFRPVILSAVLTLLYVYCHGAGNELNDSLPPVSILTWNIKMLPRGATFLHHHPIIRARIIPDVLIKEGADVVVFQEGSAYASQKAEIFLPIHTRVPEPKGDYLQTSRWRIDVQQISFKRN